MMQNGRISMLFVSEQSFQPWYYRSIPHHLRRNPLHGGSPTTSPGSSRLILYRNAQHSGHAFKSLYAPQYRMQSLGHACIFCTSKPRGHTTFFATYVLSGNSLSFGSFFFNIFSSFSNPLSGTPFSVFHYSNFSTVPSFVLSSQLGYNPFL